MVYTRPETIVALDTTLNQLTNFNTKWRLLEKLVSK